MNTDPFLPAFEKTLVNEGGYSFDHLDPGGETYMGISRVFWPNWEGWPIIDQARGQRRPLSAAIELPPMVKSFYRENFWNLIRGDEIAGMSQVVADKVFDVAVNRSRYTAIKYLQDSLNLLNDNGAIYKDLIIDGRIGHKTLTALQLFFDRRPLPKFQKERMIVNVIDTLNRSYYIEQMRRYPEKERFRGWFLR